jgi:hypothetical protein
VAGTCHPSYKRSINRRISLQAGPIINSRPYLKAKRAQVVEHLSSKCKVQGSNPVSKTNNKEYFAIDPGRGSTEKFLPVETSIFFQLGKSLGLSPGMAR